MAKGSNDLNMLLKAKVVKLRAELDVKGSMPTINKQVDEISKKLANKPVKLKVELSASISDLNRQLGLVAKTLKDSKSFKPLKIGVQIDVHGSAEAIKKQLKEVYGTVEEFNKKYGQQLKQMQEAQQKSQSKVSGKPSSSGGSVPTNGSVGGVNITAYAQQLKDAEAMMKKSFGKGLFSSFEMKDAEGNLQGFIAQLDKANGVVQKIQYKWNEEANAFTPISQQTITNTEKNINRAIKSMNELDREILKLGKNGDKFWGELDSLEDHARKGTLTQDMVDGLKKRIKDEQVLKQIIKSENDDLLAQQKLIKEIQKSRNKDWNRNQDLNRRSQFRNLANNVADTTDPNELKRYRQELQELVDLSVEKNKTDKQQQEITKKRMQNAQELRKLEKNTPTTNKIAQDLIAEAKAMNQFAKSEKDFHNIQMNMSRARDVKWMADYAKEVGDMEQKIGKALLELVKMKKITMSDYQKQMNDLPMLTKGNLGDMQNHLRGINTQINRAREENLKNRGNIVDKDNKMGVDVEQLVNSRDKEAIKEYFSILYKTKVETVDFKESVDKAGNKLTKLDIGFASTGKTARKLGLELDTVSGKLIEVSDKEAYNANRNLGIFEQLKIAMARVPIWMASMTAFYGTLHSIQAMSSEILTVDKSLTELKRVASDNIDVGALFQGAVGLSAELGNNIHDITNALNDFARTFGDFNEEQLLAITKTATLMSNVSDLSAQEATNSLVGTMNAFNIEAEKSVKIVDAMNEVDNNYAVSTKQLAEGLAKSASTAKTFGVTMEENIGHVTAISSVTMESGNVIGNSLKTIYSRITTLDNSIDTLKSVGVAVKDLNGNVRPVNDILGDLADKWHNLTDSQRQNVAVQVAGRYQLSRFLALMTNYDTALKATNTAIDSHGSAMRENAEYMKSFEARINKLKNGFTELSLAIGDAVLSDGMLVVIESLASLAKVGIQVTKTFGALPPVLLATFLILNKMNVFDKLKTAIGNSAVELGTFRKEYSKAVASGNVSKLQAMKAGWNAVTVAEGQATAGAKAFGFSLKSALISTGIGALVVALGFVVEKLISSYAKMVDQRKKSEEQLKSYQKTSEKTYLNERKYLDTLLSRYKELSTIKDKGTLSSDENKEYLKVTQELATIFPNLISYIDSKGRAHLKEAGLIDQVTEATRRNIKAKKAEMALDAEKEFKAEKKKLKGLINERADAVDDLETNQNLAKTHPLESQRKMAQKEAERLDQLIGLLDAKIDMRKNNISNKISSISDAFTNMFIDINPVVKGKVEELVASFDFSGLDETQMQTASQNIGKALEDLSEALRIGNKKDFDNAIKTLYSDFEKLGAVSKDVEKPKISFFALVDAMKKAEQGTKGYTETTEDGTDALGEFNEEQENVISNIDKLVGATSDQINTTYEMIEMYKLLNEAENLSSEQKQVLGDATAYLTDLYPDLIDGSKLNIEMMQKEVESSDILSQAITMMANGQVSAQDSMTIAMATGTKNRLTLLRKEIQAYNEFFSQANDSASTLGAEKLAMKKLPSINVDIDSLLGDMDKYTGKISKALDIKPRSSSKPSSNKSDKGSSNKNSKNPISQYISDDYSKQIDKRNLQLEQSRFKQESLTKSSKEYRNELEKQSRIQERMVEETKVEIGRLETRNGVLNRAISRYGKFESLSDKQKESYNKLREELDNNTKSVNTLKSSNLDYLTSIKDIKQQISDSLSLEFENSVNATLKKFDDEVKKIADKVDNIGFEIDVLQLTKPDDSTAILDAMGRKAKALRGERDLADAKIKELEKKYAEAVKKYGGNAVQTKSILEQINTAKEELEDYTLEAMRAEQEVRDYRASLADDAISTLKNYYSNMKEMAVNAIEAEKKALDKSHEDKMKSYDKEIAKINAVYDAKFKNMDEEKDKEVYQTELNEKNAKKSELVNKISLLSKDGSLEGKKKKAELEKELADLEKETSDFMKDRQRDLLKEQLDAQKEAQIREIEGGYNVNGEYVKGKREADEETYKSKIEKLDLEKEKISKHYDDIINNEKYWADKRAEFMKGNMATLKEELGGMFTEIDKLNSGSFDNLTESFKDFSEEVKKQVKDLNSMTIDNMKYDSDNLSNKLPESAKPTPPPSDGSQQQTSNKGRLTTGSFKTRDMAELISNEMTKSYHATSTKIIEDGEGGFKVVGDFSSVENAQKVLDRMKIKKLLSIGHISRFESGGYTGEWSGSGGKLGILDKKEIILNKNDTSNLLDTVKLVNKIKDFIPNLIQNNFKNKLDTAGGVNVTNNYELNVNIERLNGDKQGAGFVVKEIMTGLKKMGK